MFEEICYKPVTTFWQDFSIGDCLGKSAVKNFFDRAFIEWRDNYIYLTELVIVLNHKIWQHYQTNEDLARLYNALWETANDYACRTLQGEELSYFYSITD